VVKSLWAKTARNNDRRSPAPNEAAAGETAGGGRRMISVDGACEKSINGNAGH